MYGVSDGSTCGTLLLAMLRGGTSAALSAEGNHEEDVRGPVLGTGFSLSKRNNEWPIYSAPRCPSSSKLIESLSYDAAKSICTLF